MGGSCGLSKLASDQDARRRLPGACDRALEPRRAHQPGERPARHQSAQGCQRAAPRRTVLGRAPHALTALGRAIGAETEQTQVELERGGTLGAPAPDVWPKRQGPGLDAAHDLEILAVA